MKGIENANQVAAFLGATISSIATIDQNQDGKITLLEVFNKVQLLAVQAFGLYSGMNWQEFKEELKDLDPTEVRELIESFAGTFDLSDDQLEWLIEDYMRVLSDVHKIVSRTIEMNIQKRKSKTNTKA